MYNKTVMDHFRKPRNVGVIEKADGVGEVGNPLCGDMMTIYLDIEDERIKDIKFQTFGCGSAIAVSSMLTEIAKGKSIEEAKKLQIKMWPMRWRGCRKTNSTVRTWGRMRCRWPLKITRIIKRVKPDPTPNEKTNTNIPMGKNAIAHIVISKCCLRQLSAMRANLTLKRNTKI